MKHSNSVFEEIRKALEKNIDQPILHFDNYNIIQKLGHGQQALVVKATNKLNKAFAIKFYDPTDTDPTLLANGLESFEREVRLLSSFSHKNIVHVFTGGIAAWNKDGNQWIVHDGFNSDEFNDAKVYYYIMDFIDQGIEEIFPVLEVNPENKKRPHKEVTEQAKIFEDMVYQICTAIEYYQSEGITHKDIKIDNLRYSSKDNTFIIVDFGFARHLESKQDIELIVRTENMDLPSIKNNDYVRNDIAQFAMVLRTILPSLISAYDCNRYSGAQDVINKATNGNLNERYNSAKEFRASIEQCFAYSSRWNLTFQRNEFMTPGGFGKFDSKIRIPISGSFYLTDGIREIIDSKEFQRLRGVRQLGPTFFVYPGANHTRFEHSLGTYHLSIRFLQKLLQLPEFRKGVDSIEDTVKYTVLCSLLHDIGHYPYSHWVEEMGNFSDRIEIKKHESRCAEIICDGPIKIMIEDRWKVDSKIVANIIANKKVKNSSYLINSILNSVIDVDKLDYLRRDSIHCGVDYGSEIDIERVLESLYVDGERNRICLTEKGRSQLLAIISCRNIMYQEIYWHKTVRACNAMFKRFFYEYVSHEVEPVSKISDLFNCSDDYFTTHLYSTCKSSNTFRKLLSPFAYMSPREIYKPAYIYNASNRDLEPGEIQHFFDSIGNDLKDSISKGNCLVEHLKTYIPDIDDFDILIEKPPVKTELEVYALKHFRIYNVKKGYYERVPRAVEMMHEFLQELQPSYIFCHPRIYNKIKSLQENNSFYSIISDICE